MDNQNVVIHTKFLHDEMPLLVEYELDYNDDSIDVLSIRFIRKVANGCQRYCRPDGTDRSGPIYEAAWLNGWPGIEFLLTPHQLCVIDDLVSLAIRGPHESVPEDQIVYAEVKP